MIYKVVYVRTKLMLVCYDYNHSNFGNKVVCYSHKFQVTD